MSTTLVKEKIKINKITKSDEEILIKFNKIKKTYGKGEGAVNALRGVSFEINKKDFVAICGASGSGKSTLLTIIAGLNHPTVGEVIFDEISIYKGLNNDGLANFRSEYIGFVFQSFQLIPYLNTIENVMLPLAHHNLSNKQKSDMALNALERVSLLDKVKKLPGELSGGQQQRVAIARALVNSPSLILADEPTGNLDSETRDEILNLFKTILNDGHTIVMVTHDPANIKHTNKVIYLKDGLLV